MNYKEKEFKSVSDSNLELADKEEEDEEDKSSKDLFKFMKDTLGEKVVDVRLSKRLKTHPVCLSSEGAVSIEMEKVLNNMPTDQSIVAKKVLEINRNHDVYKALKEAYEKDKDKLKSYTNLLYNQALLIEGLSIEDPLEFSNEICKLMI